MKKKDHFTQTATNSTTFCGALKSYYRTTFKMTENRNILKLITSNHTFCSCSFHCFAHGSRATLFHSANSAISKHSQKILQFRI